MRIFIGYDTRQADAYEVCVRSILAHSTGRVDISPLLEAQLRGEGLYSRPHERRGQQLWDGISNAPMSTQFAATRFLVPQLRNVAEHWALYCDCDFLFRANVAELFALADQRFAVQVVKHDHAGGGAIKMDGQRQTWYARKNWSSLVLWNLYHQGTQRLSLRDINSLPGRDLHNFCWLKDHEIGALPLAWNWLSGYSDPQVEPKAVHFTNGVPALRGYENVPYAHEWFSMRYQRPKVMRLQA